MKSILSVSDAIKLIGKEKDLEALKLIVGNIKKTEGSIKPLFANLQNSFKHVVEVFKSNGVTFADVHFSLDDLDASVKALEENYSQAEEAVKAARDEYIKYNNVEFEPQLNTIERNRILADKKIIWDKALEEKENAWQAYCVAQENVKKTHSEGKDLSQFDHLVEMYKKTKDEMIGNLDKISDESLRIDIETEIAKVGKLIESIQEKEKSIDVEVTKINDVSKVLGVEIVYDRGKKEETKEVVEEKKEEKAPEVSVETTPVEEPVIEEDTPIFKEMEEFVNGFHAAGDLGPEIQSTGERSRVVRETPAIIPSEVFREIKSYSWALEVYGLDIEMGKRVNEQDIRECLEGIVRLLSKIYTHENIIARFRDIDLTTKERTKEDLDSKVQLLEEVMKQYLNNKKNNQQPEKPNLGSSMESSVSQSDDFAEEFIKRFNEFEPDLSILDTPDGPGRRG